MCSGVVRGSNSLVHFTKARKVFRVSGKDAAGHYAAAAAKLLMPEKKKSDE